MIEKLQQSTTHVEVESTTLLDFTMLDNPFGCGPHVSQLEGFLKNTKPEKHPQTSEAIFKKQISDWLSINSSMITLGIGSDELITNIPKAILQPDQAGIIITPTFYRLIEAVEQVGGNIIQITATPENQFACTPSLIEQILNTTQKANPALIWLCTPNNPTGVVFPLETIQYIAQNTEAILVVDEAYQEMIDPFNQSSAIQLLTSHRNIIVTKTLSKTFGLPKARVGIALSHPHIALALQKQRTKQLPNNSLLLAEEALLDIDWLVKTSQTITIERSFFDQAIKDLTQIKLGSDSQINVCILRHQTSNLHELLEKQGVITTDYNQNNGLEEMKFVRLGLRSRTENLMLIEVLQQIDST